MKNYKRKQLKARWEEAKARNNDPDGSIDGMYWSLITTITEDFIPGIWEVTIFPRWLFKDFLDRKIMESADSAVMSRNMSYDPDSGDSQYWGWYRWRYYYDAREGCYLIELDYNVDTGNPKALPLVKGILDLALLESKDSIIGKFKWRSRLLQRVPILRRIPPIFLFYFEMKKIDEDEESTLFAYGRETKYSRDPRGLNKWDLRKEVIKFPKASDSWGKVRFAVIGDPRGEGKCIAWFEIGDDETFTGEDHR